ncbi:MAG: hypothetical protein PHT02_01075 [Tissierellia bacterium]|nr:hypothetical protein [Tissierellia bacterium]
MKHIENIVIGEPLVTPETLLAFNTYDWNNNEKELTEFDTERFIPKLLVKHGLMSSTSEVKRNRPDLWRTLDKIDCEEIKIGKKRLFIVIGK